MRLRALAVGLIGLLAAAAERSEACATVDHDAAVGTGVSAERAIIVYDPATKTEHFIRSATFHTKGSSDFGFIVPTPSVPTFGEVDEAVFDELAAGYEAARPRRHEYTLSSMLVLSAGVEKGALPSVQELGHATVAGMDVVVVKADETAALEEWMASHGFSKRPALTEWLDHYVKQGFVFSAFRYSASSGTVTSKAARISFSTEVPRYPYFEPADSLGRQSGLDVWLIAPQRREWVDEGPSTEPPTQLAATTKLEVPRELASLINVSKPWVSLFRDRRAKRPPSDVRFAVSKETSELLPPARVEQVQVPLEGLFCLLVAAVLIIAFVRRLRVQR